MFCQPQSSVIATTRKTTMIADDSVPSTPGTLTQTLAPLPQSSAATPPSASPAAVDYDLHRQLQDLSITENISSTSKDVNICTTRVSNKEMSDSRITNVVNNTINININNTSNNNNEISDSKITNTIDINTTTNSDDNKTTSNNKNSNTIKDQDTKAGSSATAASDEDANTTRSQDSTGQSLFIHLFIYLLPIYIFYPWSTGMMCSG